MGSAETLSLEVLHGQDVFDLLACGAPAAAREARVTWQPQAAASSRPLSEAR